MTAIQNDFVKQLEAITTVQQSFDITSKLNIRIGGPVDYLVEPKSVNELKEVIQCAKAFKIPYHILGHGYNTMFVNEGYHGMVIMIDTHFTKIEVTDTCIQVDAGASLFDVCTLARNNHLTGLEFAYGIPGSMGGVTYMNAGAFNGEMKDVIELVTYLDDQGNIQTKTNQELDFAYRSSLFMKHHFVILSILIRLSKGNLETIDERMTHILTRRHEKQPLDYPNAGSTFKRPVGGYASFLIDQCGLKGYQIGGAMVSKKHAGFLINYDHASSSDMIQLIDFVKETVKKESGFELECEIEIIK